MSDIPEARRLIADAAATIEALGHTAEANLLHQALDLMHRRPMAKPRAPETSAPVDADTARAIRAYVRTMPKASLQDVADVFKTNPGRVSEAIHHDR